jgi:uncharacterized membrane protein YfcA
VIDLATVTATVAICFGSAVLQRTVGFGFALFAVPLMAFVLPTRSAVVVVFLAGSTLSVWLAARLHAAIVWPAARPLAAGTVLGAPFGVIVLGGVSAGTLRLILGVTICVAALWIIASARWTIRERGGLSPSSTLALGVISGVLNTSLATSGPPLVFALRRTGFHGDGFRATISAVFVVANLIGLPLLAVAGLITADDLQLAAVSLVPSAVGMAVGAALGARMSSVHFTWAVDVLLLATGVITVTRALG